MFEPRVQGRGRSSLLGCCASALPALTSPSFPSDWYRSFLIVDPSTTASTPIEVQWYAKAEAGLPEVQDGDVFVTRSLVVRLLFLPPFAVPADLRVT